MAELLKNLYNKNFIECLSKNIQKHYPDFQTKEFALTIFNDDWDSLELKKRMRHISTSLYQYLPTDYVKSIEILKKTYLEMDSLGFRLENIIFQDYVELYGLNHWEVSIIAMECFTINCSSEFAIRQFILQDENKAMEVLKKWAYSNNDEIRRLASEGCRPRLPWAVALPCFKKDPTKVLEILEILKDDDSKYVQKSVANNINDISKDNPEVVIDIIKRWKKYSKNRDWILKHGARTLLKSSNIEVLELFGYITSQNLQIKNFICDISVKSGEELHFTFDIESSENIAKLRVEYKLYFLRANGKHNSKVFKISEMENFRGKKNICKKYSFKAISTRRYYLGMHKISIMVNGIVLKESEFVLM